MRYDLIAPDALLEALREASDEHHLIGEVIGSGGDAAESFNARLAGPATQDATGPTDGELKSIARAEMDLSEVHGGELDATEDGAKNSENEVARPSGLQFTFDGVQSVAMQVARRPAYVEMPDEQRYAIMIDAAMSAVRKATSATLGELDTSILRDATGMPLEAGGIAAQMALNEFHESAEHPRSWSADEFASELNLRGFTDQVARSHANAMNAMLDEDAETPNDLTAAVEIHIDPVSKQMDSASLYLGRRDAQKMAVADIRWIELRGRTVPEARINVSYLH